MLEGTVWAGKTDDGQEAKFEFRRGGMFSGTYKEKLHYGFRSGSYSKRDISGTWSQDGNVVFIQISKVNVQVTISGNGMQGTVDVAYNDYYGSHRTVTKVFLQKMAQ